MQASALLTSCLNLTKWPAKYTGMTFLKKVPICFPVGQGCAGVVENVSHLENSSHLDTLIMQLTLTLTHTPALIITLILTLPLTPALMLILTLSLILILSRTATCGNYFSVWRIFCYIGMPYRRTLSLRSKWHHTSHGNVSVVIKKGRPSKSMGKGKFDPQPTQNPWTDCHQIWMA